MRRRASVMMGNGIVQQCWATEVKCLVQNSDGKELTCSVQLGIGIVLNHLPLLRRGTEVTREVKVK